MPRRLTDKQKIRKLRAVSRRLLEAYALFHDLGKDSMAKKCITMRDQVDHAFREITFNLACKQP